MCVTLKRSHNDDDQWISKYISHIEILNAHVVSLLSCSEEVFVASRVRISSG